MSEAIDLKKCPNCKEERLTSRFYKNKGNKDGLQSWCKECVSQARIDKYEERKKKRHTPVEGKRCGGCGEFKFSRHFYRNRGLKDGLMVQCKACTLSERSERARRNDPFSSENIDKKIAEFFNEG